MFGEAPKIQSILQSWMDRPEGVVGNEVDEFILIKEMDMQFKSGKEYISLKV